MRPAHVLRRFRTIGAIFMLGVLAMGGTYGILASAIDRLAQRQAESTAIAWAPLLATASSGAATAAPLRSLADGRPSAFTLFDGDGRPSIVRGAAAEAGLAGADGIDQIAAAAAHTGSPLSDLRHGADGAIAMATYVPLAGDGKARAVAVVMSDLVQARAMLRRELLMTSLELSLLIACSFGVPAFAYYWRTRQKQVGEERIAFLAQHDTPTGLLNRTFFTDKLDRKIASMTEATEFVAVHFIDLDRFKSVNDTLGHSVGDELIKTVAERLQFATGRDDFVSRFGGDEFVFAQADVRSPEQAEAAAEALRKRLAEPFHLGRHELSMTASIGVALARTDGRDAMTVLKAADTAMYRAKSEGRDAVRVYKPEMDVALQQRRLIEAALRDALDSENFLLHFQPVFEASGNKLLGFEVLLRLHVSDGEQIPPTTFIPIAEEMGLISRIGEWVLRRACKTAVTWPEGLIVAVNLSPKQFEHGDICDVVASALAESGLRPERLELEITEGMLLTDTDAVIDQLKKLKQLGVSIAMDDFGTGYSSLSYLWRFPFDKLKIDRSFMNEISGEDQNVINILKTIVSLGRTLNLQVTAEGIETQSQADILTQLECDQLQGYHFGRPMPETDVAATILNNAKSQVEAERLVAAERKLLRSAAA